MMNNAVTVTGLHVRRGGTTVFDGLDMTIPRGTITGLLGPSGCGKTTLMRSIVGVQRILSGRIDVLGAPAGSARLRRRVAYGTQGSAVYGDLTVRQNLQYLAAVLGMERGEVGRGGAGRREVDRVIAEVGLGEQARQTVGSLSGGQTSRVSLGLALLGAPELIVLDEPTVGLDPVLRADLWALFRRIADDGTTLIVSSHVMDEAARCDRLLLMRAGRAIAETTPQALLADTGEPDPEAAFLALIARDEATHAPGRRGHRAEGRR
ncbi:ABC-2 type transport system ATP-binding protein [Microbacterium resistens]|uniref:ABC-2 type transport system ATP-binding protein n=1 Tax=Microbacterium resistens TaxID=156977 RepID=A0ABU1SAH1_9MICO|nr:ABC transporter ATP-binding protein [Microbacterium resistens]MDR6866600.1 ABC-2 type transport system ATP-binding protein [Microbacterium resistens]